MSRLRPARALLIDSADLSETQTALPIRAAGCECLSVTTVAEATAHVSTFRPDLIFLDIASALDGGASVAALRASLGHREVPIVLLVESRTSEKVIEPIFSAGCTDCIARPVLTSQVRQRIASLYDIYKPISASEVPDEVSPPRGTRVHPRIPFFCQVSFVEPQDNAHLWLSGFSHNLSLGGLYVRTLLALPLRSTIQLRLHIHGARETIEGTGVVAWTNPYSARKAPTYPIGMGIEFSELSARQLMQLRKLVPAT